MTALFNSLENAARLVVRQHGYTRSDINLSRWSTTYRVSPEAVEEALKIAENGSRKLPEEAAVSTKQSIPTSEGEGK